MNIGIIGAGKVGVSFGKYLSKNDITITGFFSRSKESALEAANFTETEVFDSLENVVLHSDTLFITTPDDCIEMVWEQLKEHDLSGKIICHFSGVLSSAIFTSADEYGSMVCSIHPVYAFSDKFTSYENLGSAHLVMEGMNEAVSPLCELFKKLGHTVHIIDTDNKAKYHAAAAICSNHVIALLNGSLKLLKECGFEEEQAMEMLKPLILGNIKNVMNNGCKAALTGPIERCDTNTVRKHLNALSGTEIENAYIETARLLINIASEKNPDRNYENLAKILQK